MAERVEYREVPGHPLYRVGDDGSVWSRKVQSRWGLVRDHWRQLKPALPSGYAQVSIGRRPRLVHRLVLEVFVGPCPPGHECRHLDGCRTNNRLGNLRWGTLEEQLEDKRRHGRFVYKPRIRTGKLTEADIPEIFRLRAQGAKYKTLAAQFGVCQELIRCVLKRKAWKHVKIASSWEQQCSS